MNYRYNAQPWQGPHFGLAVGDRLVGTKSIGFSKQVSPWRQFSSLQLVWQRDEQTRELDQLTSDLAYFARRRQALLQVTGQRDQVTAWADLAALALLVLRLLLVGQLLKLMPPGDAPMKAGERRPGAVDGEWPQVVVIDEDCRLSR